jgi:hypothetical protein
MAEEYSWNWDIPDYGFNPQEETPAFDFGADVDWGLTDTSNWGMLDDSWDMFQPLEEDIDWANFDFEEEYGIPSLYDDPYTTDAYGNTWNMEAPDYDYGNILDEGWADWAGTQNWSDPLSLRELLGEEVDYASGLDPNDPMYEHDLGLLSQYGIGSGMDQYYGDQYGDAWRSPWAIGDDPLAGFNFDAEGNITAPEFSWFPSEGIETLINTGITPAGTTPAGTTSTEEATDRPVLDFLSSMFMQPRTPGGTSRPSSPFMGGASFTPPFIKRIGDALGLGGGSGLEDFWKEGYGKGGQGGLMNLIPGLGGALGGGDQGGGGMGGLMMPLGLGILAAQAAKDDRGVDLTPSVTMDPLGRYTLSGTGPEERKEFGLGEIPTSLDFSAYEDIMGGS